MEKEWVCLDCGHRFKTPWIPFNYVKCPSCGSKRVHRVDARRGWGAGPRWRRDICSQSVSY